MTRGKGSPVRADSSTVLRPLTTVPSTGTRSPGSTSSTSPGPTASAGTSTQLAPPPLLLLLVWPVAEPATCWPLCPAAAGAPAVLRSPDAVVFCSIRRAVWGMSPCRAAMSEEACSLARSSSARPTSTKPAAEARRPVANTNSQQWRAGPNTALPHATDVPCTILPMHDFCWLCCQRMHTNAVAPAMNVENYSTTAKPPIANPPSSIAGSSKNVFQRSAGSPAATQLTAKEAVAPRPTKLFMSGRPADSACQPLVMMSRPGPAQPMQTVAHTHKVSFERHALGAWHKASTWRTARWLVY